MTLCYTEALRGFWGGYSAGRRKGTRKIVKEGEFSVVKRIEPRHLKFFRVLKFGPAHTFSSVKFV